MAEVKVLLDGYLSSDLNGKCRSTMCLIRDGDVVMVSDPGTVDKQQEIVDALKREGLWVKDVNFVFITHSHLDHYRNIGMFPDAKSLDYWGVWGDGGSLNDLPNKLSEDIEIVKTPGHDYSSLTLFVKTKEGVIAICGDVFWKDNHPKKDPYASDLNKLEESRKLVLNKADYIVPGHGKMYRVEK